MEIAGAAVAAGLAGLVVYFVLRSEVRAALFTVRHLEERFKQLDIPRLRQEADSLRADFDAFGQDLLRKVDAFKRLSAEEMQRAREDVIKLAEQRSVDAAIGHIQQASVTRDEFDRLRSAVQRLGGYEEAADRLELIQELFESNDLRVLTWQSRLIRLMESGLAPEAEQDLMLANGIPIGAGQDFMKRMAKLGLVIEKRVASFWLQPDFVWLLSYTQDALWLQRQLEVHVQKEKDYQRSICADVTCLEAGLLLVAEQYELPSGHLDILARDATGADVLVELKYPAAGSAVVGQLLRYREEHVRATGGRPTRAMLVAPTVTPRIRELLAQNGLEWRESALEA